jgi:beta-glucanase (GH16 family)
MMLSTQSSKAQTYIQVWSDEFSSNTLDPNNWTAEIGTGTNGWGNNELQYYTSRPENLIIQNGHLHIIGKKENYQGSEYTSARIKTQSKKTWKYGKIEARIKLPTGQGLWPAFWMLGQNIGTVSWPACGEIDIMEHVNSDHKIHGTVHWDANGHAYYGGDTILADVTQFHVYTVEWDSASIKWFVDGSKYWSANILNGINNTNEFHEQFFILLNMAIGGNFPGSPTANSVIADTVMVDYVRVYQKGNYPANIEEGTTNTLMSLYPNPQSTSLPLQVKFNLSGKYRLEVLDAMGRIYDSREVNVHQTDTIFKIETHGLHTGMYILRSTSGSQVATEKFWISE